MKIRLYHTALSMLLVSLVACNSGSNAPNGLTLSGVASSNAPVVGVAVTAIDANGTVTHSQVTDNTGKYEMTVEGPGPYILTIPFNDIDGSPGVLSSVFVPEGNTSDSAQVNLNPITSVITSRVVGKILTATPSEDVVKNANITNASVTAARQAISELFKPVYGDLGVDQSNAKEGLNHLRIMVRTNQVSIGTGKNRHVLAIPTTGTLPTIPEASVKSGGAFILANVDTKTPIKNLIVIIGENKTFDATFGTYQPPAGQTINNLLSQGIVNADGSSGPNFDFAKQRNAVGAGQYTINLQRSVAYTNLPQPLQIGEISLPDFGRRGGTPDPNFASPLANGPFQLTQYIPYSASVLPPPFSLIGAVSGDPVHRFFQMWQQTGGDNRNLDLYTWIAVNTGQGGDTPGITPDAPAQGGELMAFYNMNPYVMKNGTFNQGDLLYWKSLAQQYAISDNYHQSVMGGTGINFFSIATGDVPYFVDENGKVAKPYDNQIENPNPLDGYPNFYQQDGYEGGSYVKCWWNPGNPDDFPAEPGVEAIWNQLATVNITEDDVGCQPNRYYLVNNYAWGYDMNGVQQPISPTNYNLPPQKVPTIAEALADKKVSWKWYTGGRDIRDVETLAHLFGVDPLVAQRLLYNAIGDPLVASTNIMTKPALKAGLDGTTNLFTDIQNHTLPAVSFVVPMNLDSGHPGFSVQEKFENFTKKLIQKVQANPELWAQTAIIITTDEGGGFLDTGYIQMQDFFGDGPRIPMILVSPYARPGFVDHTYYDHASLLKFIQYNWRLQPLSDRSRDNHPNPVTTSDPYRPINGPAIGDLLPMFQF